MTIDAAYTLDDHRFRDDDVYAGAKYRLTLRWLGPARGRSLLNVGCGAGTFTQLAYYGGFAATGSEPDPQARALAIERADGRYEVYGSGVFDLGPSHAADVVVMHDVLEHIDAEGAAVSALRSLVKPGGIAVISVPALESLFGYHDVQLGHFRRYSKTSLGRALSTHFRVDRCRYFGFTMIPAALWYSRIRRQDYPTSAAGGRLLSNVVKSLCAIESCRVPAPLGTSLVAMASVAQSRPL